MSRTPPIFPRLLLLVVIACLGACSARKEIFLHSLRERLSITDQEIRTLQFYTSADILAQTEDATTGPATILVPEQTEGVATAVGPKRIRVSFRPGHPGVWFCAHPEHTRDAYYLSTPVGGDEENLQILQDIKDRVLTHEGREYRLKYGGSATLLVGHGQMNDLRDARKIVPGRSQ